MAKKSNLEKEMDEAQKKETRKESLRLECILTDQERLVYSKELGETLTENSVAEEALKTFQAQAKSELATLKGRISGLANKLNTGREYRQVECVVTYDYKAKEKIWTRTDTGEICRTDIIPERDLQEEIEL